MILITSVKYQIFFLYMNNTSSMHSYVKYYVSKNIINRDFDRKDSLPLWRCHILIFPNINKTVFIWKFHHCICDGFSVGYLMTEFTEKFMPKSTENKLSKISVLRFESAMSV